MEDAELAAMEAELKRLEDPASPTQGSASLSFTPGEQPPAQDPEVATLEAELKRLEDPSQPPPMQGPQEQIQLSGEESGAVDERMEQYKQLPSIWQAPAIRTRAGAVAFSTNTGVDQIEEMLRKDNPEMSVDVDNGARIYSFPGDPQKYAWIPGTTMPSDVARAVPGVIGGALGTAALTPAAVAGAPAAALSVPAMIVANVVQSLLGEGAKAAVGLRPQAENVAISAAVPPAFAFAKGGANVAGKILSKAAAPIGQKVDTLVDPIVGKLKSVLARYGADPDAGALARGVADVTEPAVSAARSAASRAAADAETTAALAAAKAETDAAAARTMAMVAKDAAGATAGIASQGVRNAAQDAIAAATARAEAARTAASAPVNSVMDSTLQAFQKWAVGEPSSLDAKFLEYATGVLKDMKKQVSALYKQVRAKVPKTARLTPRKSLDALRKAIDEELAGTDKELQSKMVQKIKRAMFPKPAENGTVRMPRQGSIVAMRKLASKAGKAGTDWANEEEAVGKHMGKLLRRVEHDLARDFGADELLSKAKAKASEQFAYQKALKKALGLRGGRTLADASALPVQGKAAQGLVKGNLEPLKVIMNAAPKGMKQEVMASVVQQAINPAKGPEHMVAVINGIRNSPEVNELVFKNLPPGARTQLLGLGADMKRALTKRAQDIAAAEALETAEKTAIQRGLPGRLAAIGDVKTAAERAAGVAETAALKKVGEEKARRVAGAKISEQAAQEALREAERLNIALAPKMKEAGSALLGGNIRPLEEMFKSAPGKEAELTASTLLHTLFDPTKKGQEALNHMVDGLAKLEASPTIMRRVSSILPGVRKDLNATMQLAKRIHAGTAAGGKKAEGPLQALRDMGAWAGGRIGMTAGGLGALALGGGFTASSAAVLGGGLLGRVLASKFAKDSTVETKAANAFLASDAGKSLLRYLSMEKPITQGYLNWAANTPPVKAAARVFGMVPERFIRKLASGSEHMLREAGEQALSPNYTEEEE